MSLIQSFATGLGTQCYVVTVQEVYCKCHFFYLPNILQTHKNHQDWLFKGIVLGPDFHPERGGF